MKIFSASQIKEWDAFTIKNEPVSSIELMERAAKACTTWLLQNFSNTTSFKIFCGKGNNGGDGLAIARLLIENKFPVSVYIVETNSAGSDDFQNNLQKLKQLSSEIHFIKTDQAFPAIKKEEIVIDALFGTGLNKKPSGIFQKLINYINKAEAKTISIDMPSGLYADKSSAKNAVIHARYTLSFQQPKLAFLLAENEPFCGKVVILDIGLSPQYFGDEKSVFELIDKNQVEQIYNPRKALLPIRVITAMHAW